MARALAGTPTSPGRMDQHGGGSSYHQNVDDRVPGQHGRSDDLAQDRDGVDELHVADTGATAPGRRVAARRAQSTLHNGCVWQVGQ